MGRLRLKLRGQIPAATYTPTLWVDANGSDADDTYTRAQIRAGGGTRQWETIERAVWGSNDRDAPVPGEAADVNDVVNIKGSAVYGSPTLYTTTASLTGGSQTPVYTPANTGSAGNYITFQADGYVKLGAPAANGPVVGNVGGIDYIRWYANRANSRFIIVCDGRGGATNDTKGDTSVVNTRPDTGPIFLTAHCWIEGFDIDGGAMIDYDDNWSGIRVANGQGYTIRNNYIHDFRKDSDASPGVEDTSINQSGITMYGAQNGLIEHNLIENNGSGIYFKDTLTYQATLGNTIRYNWIRTPEVLAATAAGQGIRWSLVETSIGHDTNTIYQNVITDCLYAFGSVKGWNDDIYNNTVARCTVGVGSPGNHNGVRYWNNIFSVTDWVMLSSGGTQPGHTVCDFEHNCYYGFNAGTFMADANNHTFAAWLAEYSPDQDLDSPASVNSDPLFTNAAADDFTLQAGSPARSLASDLGVGTDAGAYQYGVAVTIGLES
jgi:hypothetical protein